MPNPDVIGGVAAAKQAGQLVVGFALESPVQGGAEGALARARAKLTRKRLDLIVLNGPDAMGAASSAVTLVGAEGEPVALPHDTKEATAERLVDHVIAAWERRRTEVPG